MGDNGKDLTAFFRKNVTPGYSLQENGKWCHTVIDSEDNDRMFIDGKEVVWKEKKNG